MKKPKTAVSTAALRLEYLMAASWFWVSAVGPDEQLVSAANRIRAHQLARQLGPHLTPAPDEVQAYARERFAAHQLHAEVK